MRSIRIGLLLVWIFAVAACGGGSTEDGTKVPDGQGVPVGGNLSGLGSNKALVLAERISGANATLTTNGPYMFRLPAGAAYNLVVVAQPVGQTCTVADGTGNVAAEVTNIAVSCSDDSTAPDARIIGGSITGLRAGNSVVLQLLADGYNQEAVASADGTFSFPQPVSGPYVVTVRTPPTRQVCTVINGQAQTVVRAPPLSVVCAASGFRLGGSVSGNRDVVVLRNANNGELLALGSDGVFSFGQPVLAGGRYTVGIATQSAGQSCRVTNGSGIGMADVADIQVACQATVAPPPPQDPVPLPPVPTTPTGVTITYGIKTFNFAWNASAGATSYRLFEDPDGLGPFAAVQIGGPLTGTSYTHLVPELLHTRLNAYYSVQACNAGGCSFTPNAVGPDLKQAIGYVKSSRSRGFTFLGEAVALSADGTTLAVGGPGEAGNATGIGGNQDDVSATRAGAVYVFTRNSGVWSQQAYIKASNTGAGDAFGSAVALSLDGNSLVVGAPDEDSSATGVNGAQGDNNAVDSGAVYVFTRAAGSWSQQAYIKASNTETGDKFGSSVALSGDGTTLAVGAASEDSSSTGVNGNQADNSAGNAGATYVFTQAAGAWSQQAYVKASNTDADDAFGASVALSRDGTTLAVGAYQERSGATVINGDQADNSSYGVGAAYVFTRAGAVWSQQAYVKPGTSALEDEFGYSLALSADGNTLAAGARRADPVPSQSGKVFIFVRTITTWSQQAALTASNASGADEFGYSLALSADGNTLAVGAHLEGGGTTGIVSGSPLDNDAALSGAAYVFTRTGSNWTQKAYLKASNTGVEDNFANAIALSSDGTTLAVGSPRESSSATGIGGDQADNSTTRAGAVYLY